MNRRIAAAFSALLLLVAMCEAYSVHRGEEPRERLATTCSQRRKNVLLARQSRQHARAEAETEEHPLVIQESAWYHERTIELRGSIRRFYPTWSEAEIAYTMARMTIDPDKPMIALTFDDGPVPGVTDRILDILEEHNARATFFVCGWRLAREENRTILRRMGALGCEIGNHTWSHRKLPEQIYDSVRYEVNNTNEAIYEATGVRPRCFRPPGGQNTYEGTRVARENNMIVVLWSQSGNVHEYDPKRIAQNVEKQIVNGRALRNGDVVLLHDTPQCMVDAVKIIVPRLVEQGYQLVTVWELLNCSGAEIVPGETYWNR